MLKKNFLLLSILKIAVLLSIFVETEIQFFLQGFFDEFRL